MDTKNPRPEGTGTGAGYAEAVAKLYTSDYTPPREESHPYQPRRVGEIVEVAHLPGVPLEVVALDDPALVTLRHAKGGVMRAGWRTIRRRE